MVPYVIGARVTGCRRLVCTITKPMQWKKRVILLTLHKCYLIFVLVDLTYSVVSYLRRLIFIVII